MSTSFDHVLDTIEPSPLLVDIGASGDCPTIWKRVASRSIYVGFDPDRRDLPEIASGHFKKQLIIASAISAEPGEATLYETKFPHCSSLLKPDAASLSDYRFASFFEVERTRQLTTISLADALKSVQLEQKIDWVKCDSQGMDLRLVQSLPKALADGLLTVDIEPGLIDAYEGEDHFVTAHQYLMANGFWPSDCKVCGNQRLRQETLTRLGKTHRELTPGLVDRVQRQSPGWIEARYLRRLDWMADHAAPLRDYKLLWCFAIVDAQYGFALETAQAIREQGEETVATQLEALTIQEMKRCLTAYRPIHAFAQFLRRGHAYLSGFYRR